MFFYEDATQRTPNEKAEAYDQLRALLTYAEGRAHWKRTNDEDQQAGAVFEMLEFLTEAAEDLPLTGGKKYDPLETHDIREAGEHVAGDLLNLYNDACCFCNSPEWIKDLLTE